MLEDGGNRSMFRSALQALRDGRPIGIFPEGGISRDGELKEIRPGAIALARQTGVPIVPVRIKGAFHALPRDAWFPRPATISVRIGAAIPVSELAPGDLPRGEALAVGAQRLYAAMNALE